MQANHNFADDMIAFVSHLIQEFMGLMRKHDLSMPQIYALMHLFHSGESQVTDIARVMGASSPAASQLVERLWQQGLVVREEDPENRRVKKIRLTEKGSDLVRQGIVSNTFLMGLFAHLTSEQRETIHTAIFYLAGATRDWLAEQEKQAKGKEV